NIADQFVLPNGSLAYHWTSGLASTDSDGDGYTNGEELQDPTGGWGFGSANPGNAARVTSPNNGNLFTPKPRLRALKRVSASRTYGGPVDLSVSFNPTYGTDGARRVVYEVLDSGANVVKSYPPIQTPPNNGGYTDTPATFNFTWDTYDVPNGTYTI